MSVFRPPPALEIRLPAERTAAIEARRAMRELLGESLPEEFAQDALLLTSEIVTNAIEVGGDCVLTAWYLPDHKALRVEVHDDNAHVPALPPANSPSQIRGRGLRIVDALASEWGIDREVHGKSVWFEIRRVDHAATLA